MTRDGYTAIVDNTECYNLTQINEFKSLYAHQCLHTNNLDKYKDAKLPLFTSCLEENNNKILLSLSYSPDIPRPPKKPSGKAPVATVNTIVYDTLQGFVVCQRDILTTLLLTCTLFAFYVSFINVNNYSFDLTYVLSGRTS